MKKIASLLLAVVMLISCAAALSSCGSEYKKFDDLVSFICEKGAELGSKNEITKNLSDFYGAGDDSTVVTVRCESTMTKIVFEETTEYDGYTVYCKAVSDQNADNVLVTVEYTYPDHKVYYEGYIMEDSFCDTNKETAIKAFKTNNDSLEEAEAMALLGTAIESLLSHANALLGNVGSPVSLYDIGFNSAYK